MQPVTCYIAQLFTLSIYWQPLVYYCIANVQLNVLDDFCLKCLHSLLISNFTSWYVWPCIRLAEVVKMSWHCTAYQPHGTAVLKDYKACMGSMLVHYVLSMWHSHTLLLIGVNLVFKQCMQVDASLSGTQTAACSWAGFLLAESAEHTITVHIYVSIPVLTFC